MTAFTIEVGQQYAAELALTYARCRMNARAKRSEVKDFARYAIECYLGQKDRDWTPSPAAQGTASRSGMAQ